MVFLMIIKIHWYLQGCIFFKIFFASLLKKLFVIFQTNDLMIPFIEAELEKLIKQLTRLVFTKAQWMKQGQLSIL